MRAFIIHFLSAEAVHAVGEHISSAAFRAFGMQSGIKGGDLQALFSCF
jgi:hypothetical protein